MAQKIIVGIIFLAALYYLISTFIKKRNKKAHCDKCAFNQDTQPYSDKYGS